MSGGQGSKWSTLKNVRTALRSSQDTPDEGQVRGWEPRREGPRPAPDPRPAPGRPAYGSSQHYPSDPGPQSGPLPWQSSPPPPPQGPSPSLHNPNYQGQYQAGSIPQGYGAPPPPNPYQPSHSQAYGQNQAYFMPPPPASRAQYHPGNQQQPMPSVNLGYQGGQSTHYSSYNQTSYQPTGNSYAPPLPQGTLGPSQSSNLAGPSYAAQSSGAPLSRTVTAPPDLHCEHRYPGTGLCPDCERRYGYRSGR